jgi:hypothetical protein
VARYTRIPDDMMVIVNFTKSEDHDYEVFEFVPQSYENEEDEWNELRLVLLRLELGHGDGDRHGAVPPHRHGDGAVR